MSISLNAAVKIITNEQPGIDHNAELISLAIRLMELEMEQERNHVLSDLKKGVYVSLDHVTR